MPKIKCAQNLSLIPENIDKTPATVAKYSSKNKGKEYSFQLDQNNDVCDKHILKQNMSQIIEKNQQQQMNS